jgi:hypothetical protein
MGWMRVMQAYACLAGSTFCGWVQKSILAALLIFLTPVFAAPQSIPGQPNLKAIFDLVGRMHNIDADLLEAIAEVESGGDPLSVSSKGALGLMQLMPATATEFSVLDPFDPVASVMGAANFIDYLRNRFANDLNLQGLPTLLAAYNAGPGAVEKYGGIPPYSETHTYVRKVIDRYTNHLKDKPAVAPVLILGPKPYVIKIQPGSDAAQLEPVVISADGDGSALNQRAPIRQVTARGMFLAIVANGTAPDNQRHSLRHPIVPALGQSHR